MKKRIGQRILNSALLSAASLVMCTSFASDAQAFDKSYVGSEKTYTAKYIDTFVHLARDYNLGFVEIRAANPGIDPWIPGEGTKLTLPTRHILPDGPREGIVINISEMRLYYYKEGADEPITFPIGVGREGLETPIGTTTVVRKTEGPYWYPTERMRKEDPTLPEVVKPGPQNPLGTNAMYLGWPQYAIHGTNRPFGIGRRISSGCIRMYPEDIKDLYAQVPEGTKVTVVDEPIKTAWIDNQFYIEAHADRDQSLEIENGGQISSAKLRKKDIQKILEAAGTKADELDWQKIYEIISQRRGYPISVLGQNLNADNYDQNARIIKTGINPDQAGPEIPVKERVNAIYKELKALEKGADPKADKQKDADAKVGKQDQDPQDVVSFVDPAASFETLNQ